MALRPILGARVTIDGWRCDYNANRLHTARGKLTPAEFALLWTTTDQPEAAYRLDHKTGPRHTFRSQ